MKIRKAFFSVTSWIVEKFGSSSYMKERIMICFLRLCPTLWNKNEVTIIDSDFVNYKLINVKTQMIKNFKEFNGNVPLST